MRKSSFRLRKNASVSLISILERAKQDLAPASAAALAGYEGRDRSRVQEIDRTTVLIEANNPDQVAEDLIQGGHCDDLEVLAKHFVSARVGTNAIQRLLDMSSVQRIQTKKLSQPLLEDAVAEIGARQAGQRTVAEDGNNVLIGIVDTGFDLSHPMFRDVNNDLRVEALLDQTDGNKEYDTNSLTADWGASGSKPGNDLDGHGTHVASIAGGTEFQGHEGVAPGARFLLVKTNFIDTDRAASWIFRKAGNRPCVINLSLGHHLGSHDGTEQEERLHGQITGPGKIIVAAGGNERDSDIHAGGWFHPGETESWTFDLLERRQTLPEAVITLWYDEQDDYQIELITPSGQTLPIPRLGNTDLYQSSALDLELSRKVYAWSNAHQVQISLSFNSSFVPKRLLRKWQLRINCQAANRGRIDGWVHNSGYAVFREHRMLEEARTIGMPASGKFCISVGSHVSKSSWNSDAGTQVDHQSVLRRSSPFSSVGPTRDGRWKPEISAPGQYITAALSDLSDLSQWDERAQENQRLATIEGTSMAAPLVASAVALMLQKEPTLTTEKIRDLLERTASRDMYTGPSRWTDVYGFGKLDIVKALAEL